MEDQPLDEPIVPKAFEQIAGPVRGPVIHHDDLEAQGHLTKPPE
jgi:hypothetical protein